MAKPTPLPLGRANPHVLQSRGAEPYIMNFYSTSYSTSFTKSNIDNNKGRLKDIPAFTGETVFKPRSAPLENKTGFTSNVRPQIYYNRNLDELDNPEMGRMLADNYETITKHDYQSYKNNTGLEELPVKVADLKSAYTQPAYNHNPRPVEVANLYPDTRIHAPYDVLPKHRAKLDKINDHNPLSNENFGYGPFYMSTETGTKFIVNKKDEKLNPAVGPKEISGFVTNKETEDVLTGVPGERWLFDDRSTGISETHSKFQNYPFPRSATQLPNICNIEQTRDSTYVKTFRPSEINPKNILYNDPSEYKDQYLGRQRPEPIAGQKLGTSVVGEKEMNGQSRNEKGHVQTLDDPRRFVTNYNMKHYNMTAVGKDREGFVSGGVNKIIDDGYTINNKIHSNGELLNTFAELKGMDPYQSRSIRATNRFYDDHTHDHKFTYTSKNVTFQDNNPNSVNTSSF